MVIYHGNGQGERADLQVNLTQRVTKVLTKWSEEDLDLKPKLLVDKLQIL
jgi:hypothetical protein